MNSYSRTRGLSVPVLVVVAKKLRRISQIQLPRLHSMPKSHESAILIVLQVAYVYFPSFWSIEQAILLRRRLSRELFVAFQCHRFALEVLGCHLHVYPWHDHDDIVKILANIYAATSRQFWSITLSWEEKDLRYTRQKGPLWQLQQLFLLLANHQSEIRSSKYLGAVAQPERFLPLVRRIVQPSKTKNIQTSIRS